MIVSILELQTSIKNRMVREILFYRLRFLKCIIIIPFPISKHFEDPITFIIADLCLNHNWK